jgi:transcription elongation GreA/GreB family factor
VILSTTLKKSGILQRIIGQLSRDLEVLFTAAKTSHEAATSEENIPDNKYCTLALEASYVAQGQANRAQEIRHSIEVYKQLLLMADNETVCLTSLVTIESPDGTVKSVFIGPLEGGLRITEGAAEIMVITPASPLGRELIGKSPGDTVEIAAGSGRLKYEIVAVF